jgi:hypothetical protein
VPEEAKMTTQRKRTFKPTVVRANNVASLFRSWNEWDEGDYVVGEYHSTYETTFKKAVQHNWRVKVTDCNFKCRDKEGKEINPIGKIITLNSAGQLNKFMKGVDIGMMVDVTYGGKQPDREDPTTEYHTFSNLEAGYAEDVSEGESNGL